MVPATPGTNFHHVPLVGGGPLLESTHLLGCGHTPAVLGEARPEDVGDLNQEVGFANRAFPLGGGTAELRVAPEFGLRITNLGISEIPISPSLKGGFTSESIVDRGNRTACGTDWFGDHPDDGRRRPPTDGLHPTVDLDGQTWSMTIYDTRGPRADRPLEFVEFGPGLDSDVDRRLLGDVAGRRVIELGCGAGHAAVGLATRGARVSAVDGNASQIDMARILATRHEVGVELHQAEPAELAFVRADQIDLVISVAALSFTPDLDRVFRQAHRVLRPGGHIALSLPHPAVLCSDPKNPLLNRHSWARQEPIGSRWVHTAEGVVTSLGRANFTVDILLELHAGGPLPVTLVVRARKLGA